MAAASALEQWARDNGSYLHPSIEVAHNDRAGFHWRARATIPSGTTVSAVPHSLALSYLNAIVDDTLPVFKQIQQKRQLAVEAIGFVYLMAQWLHRERSFWRPYLETLPDPSDGFPTPLWFDEDADVAFLEGTDVWHSALARREVYERYYATGVSLLSKAGVDTKPYTWDLFRWAISIFTSRSFSSRALAPQDSKYWTTYKTHPSGRRQTVLLDLSHLLAEDLDFPVLFPLQDAPNHDPRARIEWTFDPGRFSIFLNEGAEAGQEVFNNYGAKGNDELLLGYGFCLANNPHDGVLLTLKPPPHALQEEIRSVQPGYFAATTGEWSSEKATFRIKAPTLDPSTHNAAALFHELPEPLLELLIYILRRERGLPFTFLPHPLDFLTSQGSVGGRYLPFIARMLVQSLAPKLNGLQNKALPDPANEKQRTALIYCEAQASIVTALTTALRTYTRSLVHARAGLRLATLEDLLESYAGTSSAGGVEDFLTGIAASAGTTDGAQLRAAGWEEDVLVLLLCGAYLSSADGGELLGGPLPEYVDTGALFGSGIEDQRVEARGEDGEAAAEDLMEIVRSARRSAQSGNWVDGVTDGKSVWADERWSSSFIAGLGGKIVQFESMVAMVPVRNDQEGQEGTGGVREEARLLICLHSSGVPAG